MGHRASTTHTIILYTFSSISQKNGNHLGFTCTQPPVIHTGRNLGIFNTELFCPGDCLVARCILFSSGPNLSRHRLGNGDVMNQFLQQP